MTDEEIEKEEAFMVWMDSTLRTVAEKYCDYRYGKSLDELTDETVYLSMELIKNGKEDGYVHVSYNNAYWDDGKDVSKPVQQWFEAREEEDSE